MSLSFEVDLDVIKSQRCQSLKPLTVLRNPLENWTKAFDHFLILVIKTAFPGVSGFELNECFKVFLISFIFFFVFHKIAFCYFLTENQKANFTVPCKLSLEELLKQ